MLLNDRKCNRCGLEFNSQTCGYIPLSIDYTFGYGSTHDQERLRLDYCLECADIVAESLERECVVPPFSSEF